jgi:hypothetical protein
MAKQTFSVGQVLTAAQMTSLQQTAMLGGAASAKTASYTLVAADAGTAISMTSTSATTITVNTGLFAAGDTVQITNLGAGVCTITAGTATVNTSASLALAQYESGTLNFTSTSAAIFIKGAGGAPAAGGGMTLINTGGTSLTGASISISSIPDTYNYLMLVVENYKPATDGVEALMRYNSDSNTRYGVTADADASNIVANQTFAYVVAPNDNSTATGTSTCFIYGYANSTTWTYCTTESLSNSSSNPADANFRRWRNFYNQTNAITSITLFPQSGNFTSGTAYLYGVK